MARSPTAQAPSNVITHCGGLFGIDSEGGHVAVHVAVVDPLPVLRRGLAMGLADAGFSPEEPADLEAWADQDGERAVILSLADPGDFKRLKALSGSQPEVPVVALLIDARPDAYRWALQAGASGVLDRACQLDDVLDALHAALDGMCLLPSTVARALAATGSTPEEVTVSPMEADWMRLLATGATVGQLAEEVGYSEREMFRMLTCLYRRMGVSNRTEAMVQATRWGLLNTE